MRRLLALDAMDVFGFSNLVTLVAMLGLFVLKAWAFVDCLTHRDEEYVAAGKLNKMAWALILGLSLGAAMLWRSGPIGLLSLAGTIAAIVYLVDVRPALRSLTRR